MNKQKVKKSKNKNKWKQIKMIEKYIQNKQKVLFSILGQKVEFLILQIFVKLKIQILVTKKDKIKMIFLEKLQKYQ